MKKQQEGYKEPSRSLSAIEDFCERFDKAVRNSLVKVFYVLVNTDWDRALQSNGQHH